MENATITLLLDRILACMDDGARLRVKRDVEILLHAREKASAGGAGRPAVGGAPFELPALREAHEWLKEAGDPMRRSRP